jgi:ABC-2 type transport system permease protein
MNLNKTLRIARREYLAAVRTKGFIIGLAVAPLFMGGTVIVMALIGEGTDTADKKIAIVDQSGVVAEALIEAASERNQTSVFDAAGKKTRPAYLFEVVEPAQLDAQALRLELSDQVRAGELHAFVEIGSGVVAPSKEQQESRISYYAQNAALDDIRRWLPGAINGHLRRLRLAKAGVSDSVAANVLSWLEVDGLGLVSRDTKTGEIQEARRISKGEALGIPVALTMLVYLMVLMGSLPLLSSVMEEKTQRIAEVLLGLVRPSEFMAGKVIGGVGVSITGSAVYVASGMIALSSTGLANVVPLHAIPWLFAYLLLAVVMFGAAYAALGSVCNDPKDAQNLTFPAMIPVIVPIFFMIPVAREPLSAFSTILSLVPPFVPMLMLARMGSPVEIPLWQPLLGLLGLTATAAFAIWAGGRVFRVAILMQGMPPRLSTIIRWALKG